MLPSGKLVYNPLTGRLEDAMEAAKTPQQSIIPMEDSQAVQSPVPVNPAPVKVPAKEKPQEQLKKLKPVKPAGPTEVNAADGSGLQLKPETVEPEVTKMDVAAPAPEPTGFDAITEKYKAQREALEAGRRAADLANDPELARRQASNDMMSSIFQSTLAQQGNIFKQDRSKEMAALQASFNAANKGLDSQKVEAERLKQNALLAEKEGGLRAGEEAERRAVSKDLLSLDLNKAQLEGANLDILSKKAAQAAQNEPVSPILLQMAKKAGIELAPNTTNGEFAKVADFVKLEIQQKGQRELQNERLSAERRMQEDRLVAEGSKPKGPDAPTSAVLTDLGKRATQANVSREQIARFESLLESKYKNQQGKQLVTKLPQSLQEYGDLAFIPAEDRQMVAQGIQQAVAYKNVLAGRDPNPSTQDLIQAAKMIIVPGMTAGQFLERIKQFRSESDAQYKSIVDNYNYVKQHGSLPPMNEPQVMTTGSGKLSVGTVQDGFVFMGGNPNDPNSWRKQ